MNPYEIAARHVSPKDDKFNAVVSAIKDALHQATPPVLFLTADEIQRADEAEGVGYISFERGRKGKFLTWGTVGGDTEAIVADEHGRVYTVAPHLIQFV
jgi:hypothetical protein